MGKLRHVELKWPWVQDAVKAGRIQLKKVNGADNISDQLTKPKTRAEMEAMIRRAGG